MQDSCDALFLDSIVSYLISYWIIKCHLRLLVTFSCSVAVEALTTNSYSIADANAKLLSI